MSMRIHHQSGRSRISLVTAFALLAQPLTPVMGQTPAPQGAAWKPTPASATAATAKPAASTQASAPVAATLPWPRAYQSLSGSRIVVYQPQVSEWSGQRHMVAYAAVGVEAPGATKPALGSVKIEADTTVALDERLVSFSDWALTESNFPTLSKDQTRDVVGEIVKAMPASWRWIVSWPVWTRARSCRRTPKA